MHSLKTSPPRQGKDIVMIALVAAAVLVGAVLHGLLAAELLGERQKRLEEKAAQSFAEPTTQDPSPAAVALRPDEQKNLEQYGRELAKALGERDGRAVEAMLDNAGMAARVCEGTGSYDTPAIRGRLIKGNKLASGAWMARCMDKEHAVTFLRTRERRGLPAALLRFRGDDGSVSYVDVMVRADGAGFKAVDAFHYIFGTTSSEEVRQALFTVGSGSDEGTLLKALGMSDSDPEAGTAFLEIYKAIQAGNHAEVLRVCNALPPRLQKKRPFFIQRLQATMSLYSPQTGANAAEYRQVLSEAPSILGKDSATDLLMVDLLLLDKDYHGAEACLKRVDLAVGGDPSLKLMRGYVRLSMEDYAGVLALADEAEKEEPGLGGEATDLRLEVHLGRRNYAAAVEELRGFKKRLGVTLDRKALTAEMYRGLVESPEFAVWEKELLGGTSAPELVLTAAQQRALEQFGRDLAKAAMAKDAAKVAAMQHSEALVQAVLSDEKFDEWNTMQRFLRGKEQKLGWLGHVISGKAVFVRTCSRNGSAAVLLRIHPSLKTVDYVEVMVRPEGDSFKATNLFMHSMGTTLTEGLQEVRTGGGSEKAFFLLGLLIAPWQENQHAGIAELCRAMPVEFKKLRLFNFLYLRALGELAPTEEAYEKEYHEALNITVALLGEGRVPDSVMADLRSRENDLRGTDDCLQRLDQTLGGDAYIKYMRGFTHMEMKDFTRALELAGEAEREEPTLFEAGELRLSVHVAQQNYPAAVNELRALKEKSGVALNRQALAARASFKDFLASAEFAAWQNELDAKSQALRQFGRELAQALTSVDAGKVLAMQDLDALKERVLRCGPPYEGAHERADQFVEAMRNFAGGMLWTFMGGGEVTYVRVREHDGAPTLLLYLHRASGPDYVEVIVQEGAAGLKAVDMHLYATGTLFSHEAAAAVAAQYEYFTRQKKELPHPYLALSAMNTARRAGDHAEVVRLFGQLPYEVFVDRSFFILFVEAYCGLSNTDYEHVRAKFPSVLNLASKLFDDEGNIPPLLKAQLMSLGEEYAKADECARQLDEDIGGHSSLKCTRGHLRIRLKDHEGAIALANEAEKKQPKSTSPYYLRIAAYLDRGDPPAVVREAQAFKAKFGTVPDKEFIAKYNGYAHFAASPEYAAWQKEAAAP